ncbi:PQQ-binding-like beta-propeller repeat protein [Dactylosporangium sp. CA-139066]|uniref:outer membrane protein assembly factor BamB family protein n=1 Tax=Dactylosporangium sp. CA-139066 TaxID=3239930 RepID=UPI003D8CEF04
MPDAIIELDLSTPWEPPGPSPSRPRRVHQRWFALVAVALLTAGVLVADVPSRGFGPVFTVDGPVLSLNAAEGRIVLSRSSGAGQQIEALSLRDGRPLWSVPSEGNHNQYLAIMTDRVIGLVTEPGISDQSSTFTVLDVTTGEQLWQRKQVGGFGQAGGRIIVEDLTGVVDGPTGVFNGAEDGAVNPPAEQRDQRFLALDERTGATVWQVDAPKGSLIAFSWSAPFSLARMTELSPTGLLQIRDLDTGAVIAAHQLDWSGTLSSYRTGTSFSDTVGAAGEQVVIFKAGDRGADVYDRGSGRLLWHWQGRMLFDGPLACAQELYCVQDQDGMYTVDARTGRTVWRVAGYNTILRVESGVIALTRWNRTDNLNISGVATVDMRTGQVLRKLDNWSVMLGRLTDRVVAWKLLGDRSAVLGAVNPRTGEVTVFGKARDWNGRPDCVQSGDDLACVVTGRLSVWKLP